MEGTEEQKLPPFVMLPAWIFQKNGIWASLKGREKAVLVAIASRAENRTHINRKHISWASLETITQVSGVSRSSISEITKTLHMLDILKKGQRGNRNTYEVLYRPQSYRQLTDWPPLRKAYRRKSPPQKDQNTGRFASVNLGNGSSVKLGNSESVKLGNCLKSSY